MSKFEIKLPKMGESVAEATLTAWLKDIGDPIEFDEPIVEIATDKVDSEVPSEKKGILIEKCFKENDVIKVGETLAIIQTDEIDINVEVEEKPIIKGKSDAEVEDISITEVKIKPISIHEENTSSEDEISTNESSEHVSQMIEESVNKLIGSDDDMLGFLSPLVKSIIKKEAISSEELATIKGSGKDNRITKNDILDFLSTRDQKNDDSTTKKVEISKDFSEFSDEVIEMSKMGKIISNHMTDSLKISAHVQSFIEVDITNVHDWRNRVKTGFEMREGQKFTFTPIFIEAVAFALRQHPLMNISVDEDKITMKKKINIGMATALSDGNLIVPVIKNADQLNLVGMAKTVNDLANRARKNSLKPDDVSGGTFTVTNVGVFGSIMGTPIINQPQVGILAFGAIRKMPSVIETEQGDYIGIRKKMILSHSYDHRVVNGALGSKFIKSVKDYLENWNIDREI